MTAKETKDYILDNVQYSAKLSQYVSSGGIIDAYATIKAVAGNSNIHYLVNKHTYFMRILTGDNSCKNPAAPDWKCCTASSTCGVGEGDCDNDNDCTGDLVCGKDNCGNGFPKLFDCCIKPKKCSGIDWSCCKPSSTCGYGEGDCDKDQDCDDGMVCGKDNCGPGFPSVFDCCTYPVSPTSTTPSHSTTTISQPTTKGKSYVVHYYRV